MGSGYQYKLMVEPFFDFRLFKRCLQPAAAGVFGSLDPHSMKLDSKEQGIVIVWLASNLAMPQLVEEEVNIVGV